ncbi:MAG TPA: 5'-methylthioadenosine/S-adenosylhomocysteine nucleosidase [Thermomicrobiales bacterium]|nr:5'-methylthioadenosine/S-adenosylhomocysteine nucleosidase [Thermomicrobiales bacterium]
MKRASDAHVAVICAMDSEAVHLRGRLAGPSEEPMSRWRRTRGRIGGERVDVIVSDIGLVNAAAATSALCALERPFVILNYGCAGAHRDDIALGDVVIASEVVHFTSQIVLPDGTRRYWGFNYLASGRRTREEHIPADPELLSAARAVSSNIAIPAWPGRDVTPAVHVGTVGSADVWTQHGDSILELHTLHGSLCEEMEAAAIAQVAAIHGVPFLAVKDISNNELHAFTDLLSEGGSVLAHVEEEVGRRAATVVEALIRTLG